MYLLVDNETVVGISDENTGIQLPDSLRETVEELLMRSDIKLLYRNGDLLQETKSSYWQSLFNDVLESETRPTVLDINYGECLKFPLIDLSIFVAYASEATSLRCYDDLNGKLHALSSYEWKNVVTAVNDALSNLSHIRNFMRKVVVHSEQEYNAMCQQLMRKVAAAYGRP